MVEESKMMEYGDLGIKDEWDVLEALSQGASAHELHESHGERIAGLLADALDTLSKTSWLDPAEKTRTLLVDSPFFAALTSKSDVMKMATTPVMPVHRWKLVDHLVVRRWALEGGFTPGVISDYFDAVEAVDDDR